MPSILHILFASFAALIGIVFNGYILFVFIWNRRIQTANRLLLLHLAFVDTIFCLVILLYNSSLSATLNAATLIATNVFSPNALQTRILDTTSKSHLCRGHGFLWTILPLVLVWNVCGLCCDRYAAIYSPLHYTRLVNTKRVLYFILTVWLVGSLFAVAPLVGICPYVFWDARWACSANCLSTKTTDLSYAITYTIVSIVLPISIILACNLHMLLISKYHRHSIATAIYEVTLRAQATVTHQKNPNYLSKFKGKNALFTIVQVIGSLSVFVVPYHVVLIWEAANGKTCDELLISLTTVLLTCSPAVNAYVYGVKSRILRETVKRLLQQHVVKKENNTNIKKRLSEIFSENPQNRQSSRRMSAPPEYGRNLSISNSHYIAPGEISGSKIKTTPKSPFLRSVSLPTQTVTISVVSSENKFDKTIKSADKISSNRSPRSNITKYNHFSRGESAPEENIVICDLHVDESMHNPCVSSTAVVNSTFRKEQFLRSSSYPTTQEPTSRISKRKRLLAMRAQHAFDIEEDIVELPTQSAIESSRTNICRSEGSPLSFQVSQV